MSSARNGSSHSALEKGANLVGVIVLRALAVILFVCPIVVLVRGYMIIGDQKENGWLMYALCLIAAVWSGALWRWSKRG